MALQSSLGRNAPASTNGTRSIQRDPGGATAGTRSAPLALLGVASVVVGALVFLGIYTSIDRRQSVLVAARPVAPGQLIAAEDLAVASISASDAAASVPASRRSEVVGQPAAVGLVPGAILAPPQVGASSGLQAGQAQVGVALQPGQAPVGLREGSRVRVVDTGVDAAGEQGGPAVLSTTAVVSDVGTASTSSATTVVSLTVAEDEAAAVASAGAAGRVSLVVLPSS